MSALVVRGDAANLPLPDASVDLVVTSPPYWSLRSYTDGGEHYDGQLGAEPTVGEYLDNLVACTAEWMRVLKPSGSLFLNLGDKYSTGNSGQSGMAKLGEQYRGGGHTQAKAKTRSAAVPGMAPKSLIGLPWRYALRCIDDLGLILRAEIVWSKPNGLPESVTDRVRRSHEQVFHFVKQPRYYSAVDEIREPTGNYKGAAPAPLADRVTALKVPGNVPMSGTALTANPLGKLPGSVWEIPTAPLKVPDELGVDHFAAYPPELVRRIVLGWSPREVCTACGEGRRPVAEKATAGRARDDAGDGGRGFRGLPGYGDIKRSAWTEGVTRSITGYACACPDTSAPATPGVVLDPFGGTGTTALVADVLGRTGISVDLSADYCRLATWRTTDEKQRAKVAALPKPKKGQPARKAPAKPPPVTSRPQLQVVADQLGIQIFEDEASA